VAFDVQESRFSFARAESGGDGAGAAVSVEESATGGGGIGEGSTCASAVTWASVLRGIGDSSGVGAECERTAGCFCAFVRARGIASGDVAALRNLTPQADSSPFVASSVRTTSTVEDSLLLNANGSGAAKTAGMVTLRFSGKTAISLSTSSGAASGELMEVASGIGGGRGETVLAAEGTAGAAAPGAVRAPNFACDFSCIHAGSSTDARREPRRSIMPGRDIFGAVAAD
jgi:hypothetical protein